MPLSVTTFVTAPVETNTYVVQAETRCWVVDPGMGDEPVRGFLTRHGLALERIVLTHGHCDHIAGVAELKEAWPDAVLCCPAADAEMLGNDVLNLSRPFGFPLTCPPPDELLQPGQVLKLGPTAWQVLDTSGHTPGGASFHCPAEAVVFTGDALFAQGIGRCDLPGSDEAALLNNIRRNLLTLPADTRVYPGHGPTTTIGAEKRFNPFLTP